MSNAIRPAGTPRVEIWSALASDSGTRLCFVKEPLSLATVQSLEGPESLAMQLGRTSPAVDSIAENRVVRLWRSDSDYEEWPITGAITSKRDKGSRVDILGQPTLYRLGTCGLVTEYDPAPTNGLVQLDVGVSQLLIEEIIQKYVLDHPVISAQLPWLTMGTMDFDDILFDLQWNAATPLQVIRAGVVEIQKQLRPGQLAELAPLRRISNTSYAIDVVAGVGMSRARVSLTLSRNLTSLEEKNDPTDRASQLVAVAQPIGGFPTFLGGARWRVVSVNSGAKTLVLEDPAGGAGPIGFDDQLIGWYVYREKTGETALITDSVAGTTQQLTLTAFITGLSADEYIQFRMDEPATGLVGSGNGLQPYYLEHPVYAATSAPGIGVKLRTLDRTDVASVANVCPNAIMKQWSDHAAMPDGWTFSGIATGASTALSPYGSIAYNNDRLFTKSGQSLFFSMYFGTIITPPFAFTPIRANQRLSVAMRLYLTQWTGNGAQIGISLGIMRADGTVDQWMDPGRTQLWQPTSFRQPTTAWIPLAANAWDTIGIQGVDVTTESDPAAPNNYHFANLYRVTAADIAALPVDALGIVAMLWFSADHSAGPTNIEGYLDGVMLTVTDEAAPEISEFGRANAVWQDVNVNLADLAPPQNGYVVSMIDKFGMNPTLTDEEVGLGGRALLNGREMGLVNVERRFAEVRKNHLVPGDIQVLLASKKRRITTLVGSSGGSSIGGTGAGAGTTPGGTSPCGCHGAGTTTTVGGTSGPTILLTLESLVADVPTIKATVSPGVVAVKFSTDPSAYPNLATTQGETATTTTPFTLVGSAMTPGDLLYVSALAYDNNGVESAIAHLLVEDPVTGFTDPGVQVDTMLIDMADSFQAGSNQSKKRWSYAGFHIYDGTSAEDSDEFDYFSFGDPRTVNPHPHDYSATFAYNLNGQTVPAYGMPLVRYSGNGIGDIVILMLLADRTLQHVAWNGASYVPIGSPSTAQWPATGLTFGESRVILDSADSLAWFRIENVLALHDESIDLTSAMTNGINAGAVGQGSGPFSDYDPSGGNGGVGGGKWQHVAFWDPNGAAPYDYAGRVKIAAVAPTGNGTYSDSGASASAVATANGDTSYANNTATNNKDTFTVAAPVGGIVTVLALLPYVYRRAENISGINTVCNFRLIVQSGATLIDSGEDVVSGIAYTASLGGTTTPRRWCIPQDPNTSAPWTSTGIANHEVGAKAVLIDTTGGSVNEIHFSQLGSEYAYRD